MYFFPKQVLEFVDEHGNEVLNLGSFTLLPQHVVRLIMAREELKADEFTKFQVSELILKSTDNIGNLKKIGPEINFYNLAYN